MISHYANQKIRGKRVGRCPTNEWLAACLEIETEGERSPSVADQMHPSFQRDPLAVAATGRHSQDETGLEGFEGSSPTDGPGAARAVDPNYCGKCTPKGLPCRCEIACNE